MDGFMSKENKMKFFSVSFLTALAANYLNKYFKHVYLRCGNVLAVKLTFNSNDQGT